MRTHYLEHGVGAGGCCVGLGCLSRPIAITVYQEVQDFFCRIDLDLLEASNDNTFLRILSQFEIAIRSILVRRTRCVNQVADVLVVDLQEGYSDFVRAVHFEVFKHTKDLFHSLVHDPGSFLVSQHRVSLASTRRSVRKNGGVKAIEYAFD